MTERPDDAMLDRVLDAWAVPALGDDFAAHVTAAALAGDRPRTPPLPRPHRRSRRWTRRGIWTGIVAFNLVLASAVAAAFGGGVLDIGRIRHVAARVIEHIVPHRAPRRHPLVSPPHRSMVAAHPPMPRPAAPVAGPPALRLGLRPPPPRLAHAPIRPRLQIMRRDRAAPPPVARHVGRHVAYGRDRPAWRERHRLERRPPGDGVGRRRWPGDGAFADGARRPPAWDGAVRRDRDRWAGPALRRPDWVGRGRGMGDRPRFRGAWRPGGPRPWRRRF